MAFRNLRLFRLFGFQVNLNVTWFILAFLLGWSLAFGYFPMVHPGLTWGTYFWMGLVGTVGLFFSIVLHELCHSLVGRRFGHRIRGITLFMLGGVAEMEEEPPSPKAEFLMAGVGPLFSLVFGAVFLGVYGLSVRWGWPVPVRGVLSYLGGLNLILAAFNLLPGFPLDGGRIFRSALWAWKKNFMEATRIASRSGVLFAALLMGFALINVLGGNFIGGLWLFVIGLFLRAAALQSYQQLLFRDALRGVHVDRFLHPEEVVSVDPSISVADLVENYFYRHYFRSYPVVSDGRLVACVNAEDVKSTPREEWPLRRVEDIASRCSREDVVTPDVELAEAYRRMLREGKNRLLVSEGGRFKGILFLKDLTDFVTMRMELSRPSLARGAGAH